MTDQDKIESAAEILTRELGTDRHIVLALARRMYDIWHPRVQVTDLAPGEVARKMRERYEEPPLNWGMKELSPALRDIITPPLED